MDRSNVCPAWATQVTMASWKLLFWDKPINNIAHVIDIELDKRYDVPYFTEAHCFCIIYYPVEAKRLHTITVPTAHHHKNDPTWWLYHFSINYTIIWGDDIQKISNIACIRTEFEPLMNVLRKFSWFCMIQRISSWSSMLFKV